MKKIALTVAMLCTVNAFAGDLNQIGTLTQNQFLKLSTDLGAASAYKGVTPATPLGALGFDIGAEITQTSIENSAILRQAGGGDITNLYVPKIHITKGLPYGFDIGAFVSRVSGVNGMLIGLEARYAIVEDGLTTPAIGVRLSGSRLSGITNFKLSTIAVDAMLSKKLTLITPYIGAGSVRVTSRADIAGLREENFNKSRVFIGMNVNFLLANIALEAEKMGDNTSLSAKAGFRF